jgi:hypothetical protein
MMAATSTIELLMLSAKARRTAMRGEKIYEYDLDMTNVTDFGVRSAPQMESYFVGRGLRRNLAMLVASEIKQ